MRRAAIDLSSQWLLLRLSSPQTLTFRLFFSSSASQCETLDPLPPLRSIPTPESPSPDDDVIAVLRRWGCTTVEVAKILRRHPSLARASPASLHTKLTTFCDLGFSGCDLLRLIATRPILLHCTRKFLAPRIDFLRTVFGADAGFRRVVLHDPVVLHYPVERMRRCVELYDRMGLTREELSRVLYGRPAIIPRSNLDEAEKLEIIRRTGVPKGAKMYKYVVSIVAVSRLETLQEKIANLEKFGFTVDEVLQLFGRTPNLLTLSVDKVQRNMTFVLGTMQVPLEKVLQYTVLIFGNLDRVIKPRFLVFRKMEEMGLTFTSRTKLTSVYSMLRMREDQFLDKCIRCQEPTAAKELMEFYNELMEVRRLAEGSRARTRRSFPY